VTLLKVIEESILSSDFSPDVQKACTVHLKEFLIPRYLEELTKEIQAAYLESYADYGQELFDRYVAFAISGSRKKSYVEPGDRGCLRQGDAQCRARELEKPRASAIPRTSGTRIVNHVLRAQNKNGGDKLVWTITRSSAR